MSRASVKAETRSRLDERVEHDTLFVVRASEEDGSDQVRPGASD